MAKINHWGDLVNFGPNAKDQINNVALRSLLIANRLNFYWPKDPDSSLTTLASAINLPTQWAKNLRHLHTARPSSISLHEASGYPVEEQFGTNRVIERRMKSSTTGQVTALVEDVINYLKNPEKSYTGSDPERDLEIQRANKGFDIGYRSPDDDEIIPRDYAEDHLTALQQAKAEGNHIYLLNTHVTPYIAIEIETRPKSVSVDPKSNWVSVKSMGRNNPFYFYTGGEDSITFEVSWFVKDHTQGDYQYEVLSKCRLLESWSKANYYYNAPPTLRLVWGNADIFRHCMFIIESCPYTINGFNDHARVIDRESGVYQLIDGQLLPSYANQTITLKRVSSDNTTSDQIWTEYDKSVRGIARQTTYNSNLTIV